MRAMVVSDLHFGGEDRQALTATERFCARFTPDLILVAGDVSSTGRRREMAAAALWLRSLGRPVIATPGNHDSPYWNPFARLVSPFGRFDRLMAFETPAHERITVRTLNTARGLQLRRWDWSLGVANRGDIEAIVAACENDQPETLRIVLAHHPLRAPEEHDERARTRYGEEAAARLAFGGVDLVLSGHLHLPFVRELAPGSRAYAIGSGTLSHRVRGAPPSFVALTSDTPETLRVEHVACIAAEPAIAETLILPLRPGRLRRAT